MNTLQSILGSIEQLKPVADMDPAIGPYETAVGRRGQKMLAIEQISNLKLEYKKILTATGVFILVTGPAREAFSSMAGSEAFECFVVDPDDFYRGLISKINPSLFGRERTSYLFQQVQDALYDRAMQLGVDSYNSLQYSNDYSAYVKTPEEFLPIVRQAFNRQVGSEMVGLHIIDTLVGQAIERGHAASVTPIVVDCSDEALAIDLSANLPSLFKNVFLVSAGKPSKPIAGTKNMIQVKSASEESVGNALTTVRSLIKK